MKSVILAFCPPFYGSEFVWQSGNLECHLRIDQWKQQTSEKQMNEVRRSYFFVKSTNQLLARCWSIKIKARFISMFSESSVKLTFLPRKMKWCMHGDRFLKYHTHIGVLNFVDLLWRFIVKNSAKTRFWKLPPRRTVNR